MKGRLISFSNGKIFTCNEAIELTVHGQHCRVTLSFGSDILGDASVISRVL